MRKVFLKLVLVAVGLAVTGALSASRPIAPAGISVEIIGDDGRAFARYPLSTAADPLSTRAYLEAVRGERYAIRIRNHTPNRIGVVIAVDGRNIISGQKSHLRATESMYVLDPYRHATYRGWRTSATEVHRFYFTDAADSYAEAFDDRSAMGVIAVAAYQERVPEIRPDEQRLRSEAAPGPAKKPRSPQAAGEPTESYDDAAGTGFGERRHSRSVRVHFNPQTVAFAKQFLKYEWRETLVRLGVIPAQRPNRFWPPVEPQVYAPYPPAYR